jgi:hypothetical protein
MAKTAFGKCAQVQRGIQGFHRLGSPVRGSSLSTNTGLRRNPENIVGRQDSVLAGAEAARGSLNKNGYYHYEIFPIGQIADAVAPTDNAIKCVTAL